MAEPRCPAGHPSACFAEHSLCTAPECATQPEVHIPLDLATHPSRAQIQAEVWYLRREQAKAVIPSTARERGLLVDPYLDALLALEPEPA